MNNNQRNCNGIIFFAGAVIGGVAMHFLQSPRGQKMKNVILEKAEDITSEMKNKAMDAVSNVSNITDSVIENSKSALSQVKTQMIKSKYDLAEAGEDKIDEFQKGVKRAKESMKEHLNGV